MSIPTALTPRFEVRQLEAKDVAVVSAIMSHTNVFHSPMWAVAQPDDQTKRCYDLYNSLDYLVGAAIASRLSYAVYDKEYKFKRPESAVTDGALYWDHTNLTATSQHLLDEIDSPLVSVCLAYDGFHPLDLNQLTDLFEILPLFATMHEHFHEIDTRDPKSWEPTSAGQVIMRTGTSTRADYAEMGIMKMMAHWEMKDAAAKGFRGINMETLHPAVDKVWMNPPAPFKATRVNIFNMNELTIEVNGEKVIAAPQVDVLAGRMYVDLTS
ncbi:hypothetical protein BGW36DRAFT_368213 [Talaromyces proteolyticus]|uniref:Uncharacterized protein n=1 Tax=Talaromyces proteolyticus TaxID=1131652 RepID=A0AAD4L3B1_9EURO|nr:uncharacterized protein BGW36DRAFT_368213 [Talaromyces proteolyticus]KAH8705816.1 hypothetical protein BGW36DRAFT_368213 [Talaromyces proteolyticus]